MTARTEKRFWDDLNSVALDQLGELVAAVDFCQGAFDTPMQRNAIEPRGRDGDDVLHRLSQFDRFGEPSEIAAALWLCSDASAFTTGHALAADGGMVAM